VRMTSSEIKGVCGLALGPCFILASNETSFSAFHPFWSICRWYEGLREIPERQVISLARWVCSLESPNKPSRTIRKDHQKLLAPLTWKVPTKGRQDHRNSQNAMNSESEENPNQIQDNMHNI
jgi:hypothetical protein